MESKNPSIPPLLIERAALGEFGPKELEELRKRFGPSFDVRVEELVAHNESWAQDDARKVEVKQIEHIAQSEQEPSRWRAWFAVPAAAAVACVALFLLVRDLGPESSPKDLVAMADEPRAPAQPREETRLKGLSPHLTLHRKTDKGQERLAPNALAKRGDLIQLSYVAADAKFGVIVSIDGRGQSTLHFPSQQHGKVTLNRKGKVPLAHAYELDDAPDFEKFYFVSYAGPKAPKNFVAEVLKGAEALAKSKAQLVREKKLPLPGVWSQSSFLLRKASTEK